uniref:Uncharacterized protein n=1 Tax=uncultured Thiotrichaceae bacterium TaxID=298394 RepID=A0A6S6SBH7_9GAMM|nr:MAG: Unknown protein [uncultured Thiotrichaceae bacterium]
MHETDIENLKFNLDYVDRSENSCFVSGWIHSSGAIIESLRVEIPGQLTQESNQLDIRTDVNKFYNLPKKLRSGFKFILETQGEFSSLVFSVKLRGIEEYQLIKAVQNPHRVEEPAPQIPSININNPFPGMIVVEDFYDNPDLVREYAMAQEFNPNLQHHKGARTQTKTIFEGTKSFLEATLHKRITNWDEHLYNGVFQYCVAEDSLVYHTDHQSYAAVVFLTPDAPVECGTSFYKSKHNGLMNTPTQADCERTGKSMNQLSQEMFDGNYYDKTRWETVDVIGNIYNRMIIWDAQKVHAASAYFGNRMENSRLFHMFFFDAG